MKPWERDLMLHEPLAARPACQSTSSSLCARLAICDYSGHAFPAELSRELARRDHHVLHLHFAEFQSPKGPLHRLDTDPETFSVEAISLGRLFSKHRFVRRRLEEIEIGRRFADRIAAFAPNVVVGCNMPLDTVAQVVDRTKRGGSRFVFWQQDIYSVAIEKILARKFGGLVGTIVGRHYRRLEKSVLEASDSIIAISPDFVRADSTVFGIDEERIHVIENWASLNDIRPGPKDNPWSRRHGLAGREVVLYSGTLGMKHDPSLLLDLAHALGQRKDAVLVVASEGPAADWLAREGAGLNSLRVLAFQAYEEYADVLATADVLVAVLEPDAGEFSVPSKILSYLCSGRPIVLSAPNANLSSRTIEKAGAGVAVSAEWRRGFISAVISLLNEPERRLKCCSAARTYATQHFDVQPIAERFLDAIHSGLQPHVCCEETRSPLESRQ